MQLYLNIKRFFFKKDFNAPFDVNLQKRFNNSKIENIELTMMIKLLI